jgi:hypothetical protein
MNELLDKLANDHAHGDGNGATRYETLRVATVNNVKIYHVRVWFGGGHGVTEGVITDKKILIGPFRAYTATLERGENDNEAARFEWLEDNGGDPYRAHIVYNDELEVLA